MIANETTICQSQNNMDVSNAFHCTAFTRISKTYTVIVGYIKLQRDERLNNKTKTQNKTKQRFSPMSKQWMKNIYDWQQPTKTIALYVCFWLDTLVSWRTKHVSTIKFSICMFHWDKFDTHLLFEFFFIVSKRLIFAYDINFSFRLLWTLSEMIYVLLTISKDVRIRIFQEDKSKACLHLYFQINVYMYMYDVNQTHHYLFYWQRKYQQLLVIARIPLSISYRHKLTHIISGD